MRPRSLSILAESRFNGQSIEPSNTGVAKPISEFVFKVASRCNLNCTYCYMYNLADTSWRQQPKFMSDSTFNKAVDRLLEHAIEHSLDEVRIIFHGGEPFLAGPERFDKWCTYAHRMFNRERINLTLSGQSNGLLFTPELGDIFLNHNVTFGFSVDGIPGKGDGSRLDHKGERVGYRLQNTLLDLLHSKYSAIFSGIISVVNLEATATETLEYLLQFEPPGIDFHPHLMNHDTIQSFYPLSKWFMELFDYLVDKNPGVRIRLLSSLGQAIVGNPLAIHTRGYMEFWAGVVETNGALDLIDAIKSSADGMTKTGLNVFDNSIDEFSHYIDAWTKSVGLNSLPKDCQKCPFENVCMGGYYPHRYSEANMFRNRDVYCEEWKKLILHMYSRMNEISNRYTRHCDDELNGEL